MTENKRSGRPSVRPAGRPSGNLSSGRRSGNLPSGRRSGRFKSRNSDVMLSSVEKVKQFFENIL
jgi:hypothetical protein